MVEYPRIVQNISNGAPDEEIGQQISFDILLVNGPDGFVLNSIAVSLDGSLQMNVASLGLGPAKFRIIARDNGGTANGGYDTSQPSNFDTFLVYNPPPVQTLLLSQTSLNAVLMQWQYPSVFVTYGREIEITFQVHVQCKSHSGVLLNVFDKYWNNSMCDTVCQAVLKDIPLRSNVSVDLKVVNVAGESLPVSKQISLASSNSAPSFSLLRFVQALEDAGLTKIPNTAYDITAGSPEESWQKLTFSVSTDLPSAFQIIPYIDGNGTLTFESKPNYNGYINCTVILTDNGGTLFGGIDVSQPKYVSILILTVNDPPSFRLSTNIVTTVEDFGHYVNNFFAYDISAGPIDERWQKMTFTVSSTSLTGSGIFYVLPTLNSAGTLTFETLPDASGSSNWTVQLQDDGGNTYGNSMSQSQTFSIIVLPVNDAPIFTLLETSISVMQQYGSITKKIVSGMSPGPQDESGQKLSFTLIKLTGAQNFFTSTPSIDLNGFITFSRIPGAYGQTNWSIQLNDDGGELNGGISMTQKTFTFYLYGTPDPVSDASIQYQESEAFIIWRHLDLPFVTSKGSYNAATSFLVSLHECRDSCTLTSMIEVPSQACGNYCNVSYLANAGITYSVSIVAQNDVGQSDAIFTRIFVPDLIPKVDYISVQSADMTMGGGLTVIITNFPKVQPNEISIKIGIAYQISNIVAYDYADATSTVPSKTTIAFSVPPWDTAQFVNISISLMQKPNKLVVFQFEYYQNSIPRISYFFPTMGSTTGGQSLRISVINVFGSTQNLSDWTLAFGGVGSSLSSYVQASSNEISITAIVPAQPNVQVESTIQGVLVFKSTYSMPLSFVYTPPCDYSQFCQLTNANFMPNEYLLQSDRSGSLTCDVKYCLDTLSFSPPYVISFSPTSGSTKGGDILELALESDTLLASSQMNQNGIQVSYNSIVQSSTMFQSARLTVVSFIAPAYHSECCCGRNRTCVVSFDVVDILPRRSLSVQYEYIAPIEGPPVISNIYPGCTKVNPASCMSSPVLTSQTFEIVIDLENFPMVEGGNEGDVHIQFDLDPSATVVVVSSTIATTKVRISCVAPAAAGNYSGVIWYSGFPLSDPFIVYVTNPPTPHVESVFPNKFTEGEIVSFQAQVNDFSSGVTINTVLASSLTDKNTYQSVFEVARDASSNTGNLRVAFSEILPKSVYTLSMRGSFGSTGQNFQIDVQFEVSGAPYIGYIFPSTGPVLFSTSVNIILYNADTFLRTNFYVRFLDQALEPNSIQQANMNSSTLYISFKTPSIASIGVVTFCITRFKASCEEVYSSFQFTPPTPQLSRRASSKGGTEVEVVFYGTTASALVYAFPPTKSSGLQRTQLTSQRISTCTSSTVCFQSLKIVTLALASGSTMLAEIVNGDNRQNFTIAYFIEPDILSIRPTTASIKGADVVEVSLQNFPIISTALDVRVYLRNVLSKVSVVLGYNSFNFIVPRTDLVASTQLSIVPSISVSAEELLDLTVAVPFSYTSPVAKVLTLNPSRGSMEGGTVVRMTISHYPRQLKMTDITISFGSSKFAAVTSILYSDSSSGETILEAIMPALPLGVQQATVVVNDGYESSSFLTYESFDSSIRSTCNRTGMFSLDQMIQITGNCSGGVDGKDILLISVTNLGIITSTDQLVIRIGAEYATNIKLVNSTVQKTYVLVLTPNTNMYQKSSTVDLTITNILSKSRQGTTKFRYIAAPSLISAIFNSFGSSISIEFSDSTNIFSMQASQRSDCNAFLDPLTTAKLGKSGSCTWNDERTLNVILSYGATILPNDKVEIKPQILKDSSNLGPYCNGQVQIAVPSGLAKPVFQLVGPQEVGPCDTVEIMALGSFARPLTFNWKCLQCQQVTQTRLSLTSADRISLTSSDFVDSAGTYEVQVYGTNFLGAKSDTLSLQFEKTSLPIPVVSLSGFDSFSKFDDIIFEAKTAFSTCSQQMALQFQWTQLEIAGENTNNLIPKSALARNSPTFFLPKGTLSTPGPYSLRLLVILPTNPPAVTSADVSFRLMASDLVAVIRNGDSKLGRGSSHLYLDGRASYDPDVPTGATDPSLEFQWSCQVSGMICRDRVSNIPFSFPGQPEINMYTEGFDVNVNYQFTLQVSKDSRTASSSVIMVFVDEYVPTTSILSLSTILVKGKNFLNPDQTMSVLENSCTSCTSFIWELQDQENLKVLSGTANSIFVPPSMFIQGRKYTVIVNSYQVPQGDQFCNGLCKGSAFFDFVINRAPSGGTCGVNPTTGYEVQTRFRVECGSFSDSDIPLTFQFSYEISSSSESPSFAPSQSPIRDLYLPSGKANITVIVMDSLGAESLYKLSQISVLPISSIAPNDAQAALDTFIQLGKTSDFSNFAVSLTQKLSRESSNTGSRRALFALSNNVEIRSNTIISLSQIISKQAPTAGNVLETLSTLTFLVNSTEGLTMQATIAAVGVVYNTTSLIPLVIGQDLGNADLRNVLLIVSVIKTSVFQQLGLTSSQEITSMQLLTESIYTSLSCSTFDFVDQSQNLVCNSDCTSTDTTFVVYKKRFTQGKQLVESSIPYRFMTLNISDVDSSLSSISDLLFVYMYLWKQPFQIHGEQFISDMFGFALVSTDVTVSEALKSRQRGFIAELPIGSVDLSHILWSCVMYDDGWTTDFCVPIDFTANQVSCSCKQNGLIAVMISTNDICGDGRVTGQEQCDDGNQDSNDGCGADCRLEQFFTCEIGDSLHASQCRPLKTRGCSPQLLGSDCNEMCLVQLVNSECPQQTEIPIHETIESIDGSQGGEILLQSWGSVIVPAMAFEGVIDIAIFIYDKVPLTQGPEHGPTIVLGPAGTILAKPLTLSLNTISLPEAQKSSYALFSLNSASLTWEYVETQVDLQTNRLQSAINQLSVFAVRIKPAAAGQSPAPSTNQQTVVNDTSSVPPGSNHANQSTSLIIFAVSGVVGICALLLIAYRRRAIWSLISNHAWSRKATDDNVLVPMHETHATQKETISLQLSSEAKSEPAGNHEADSVDEYGVILRAQTDYFSNTEITVSEAACEIDEIPASLPSELKSNDPTFSKQVAEQPVPAAPKLD
eukprot:11924-Hanusia_phi.AAC.1